MKMPDRIHIRETCPREGWQRFKCFIPTEKKIRLVKAMVDSGAKDIELGIVSSLPKLAWQFTDLPALLKAMLDYTAGKGVCFSAQVEDAETVRKALDMGFRHVHFFVSMSEAFSRAVSGQSSEYSLRELEKAIPLGATIDIGFGAALACPYGELIPDERVLDRIERVRQLGVRRYSLADTGGVAAPDHVRHILHLIGERYDLGEVSVHLHQTSGMGMANAFAAMEEGVASLDASLGALGGCPFVKGAKGNIATEDLLNMVLVMGMKCELDLERTVEASLLQSSLLDTPVISSIAGIHQARRQERANTEN